MIDFVHTHEVIFMLLIVAVVVVGVLHYERRKDRIAVMGDPGQRQTVEQPRIWQCASFNGGGSVYTPEPMTRGDACRWASALGSIAYVDSEYGKIFYKVRQ